MQKKLDKEDVKIYNYSYDFYQKTHTHTQKERKNTIQKGFKDFKDLLFSEKKYSKYYIKF